jgi:hypothetical protein
VVAVLTRASGLAPDYRGGRGMAREIGHLTVDYSRPAGRPLVRPEPRGPALVRCPARARCGGWLGDATARAGTSALASPARIAGEFHRVRGLRAVPRRPAVARRLTRAGGFRRGRAGPAGVPRDAQRRQPGQLAAPPALASPAEGSNAAEYTRAVERALDRDCFSSAAADARAGRPTLLTESTGPYPFTGAQAAAVCVLDSFLAYTRGEDTESLADTPGPHGPTATHLAASPARQHPPRQAGREGPVSACPVLFPRRTPGDRPNGSRTRRARGAGTS